MAGGGEAREKRGVIRLARVGLSAGTVSAEFTRGALEVQSIRPWSIRRGIRRLLEMKNTVPPRPSDWSDTPPPFTGETNQWDKNSKNPCDNTRKISCPTFARISDFLRFVQPAPRAPFYQIGHWFARAVRRRVLR